MRRRTFLGLALAAATTSRQALAGAAVRRVGILFQGQPEEVEGFLKDWGLLKSLAALGYVRGRNLSLEWRSLSLDFSRAPPMARELVRSEVDLLVCQGTASTRAFQGATKTIPIVAAVDDPVASGFARSLGRPGGNITGLCFQHPDTPAKQVELLRRVVPDLERLVIVGGTHLGAKERVRPLEAAARAAGLVPEARFIEENEFERVFREMKDYRARAMLIAFPGLPEEAVAKLAIQYRVATLHTLAALDGSTAARYTERGGLMVFSMFSQRPMQDLASIIDKIFKGMNPAEIPWQLPDRSHLAINLRTAKALGVKIPTDLVLRADQVVE